MTKFELTCQPRFCGDPQWATFLNIIRKRRPTAAELRQYLGPIQRLSKPEATALVSKKVRALCSYRNDVAAYNDAAIRNSFPAGELVPVPLLTNADMDDPELKEWLKDTKFWGVQTIAIGAPVALNGGNINVLEGATNGATGVVHALEYVLHEDEEDGGGSRTGPCRTNRRGGIRGPKVVVTDVKDIPANAGMLYAIHVKLDGQPAGKPPLRVCRSASKRKFGHRSNKTTFVKSTFPLLLVRLGRS